MLFTSNSLLEIVSPHPFRAPHHLCTTTLASSLALASAFSTYQDLLSLPLSPLSTLPATRTPLSIPASITLADSSSSSSSSTGGFHVHVCPLVNGQQHRHQHSDPSSAPHEAPPRVHAQLHVGDGPGHFAGPGDGPGDGPGEGPGDGPGPPPLMVIPDSSTVAGQDEAGSLVQGGASSQPMLVDPQ